MQLRESGLAYSMGEPAEWISLLAETPERFFLEYEDARFVFITDETGHVIRLDVMDGDEVFPLDRVAE